MAKNVVLTGFMACGKSTIGRALAQKTGRCFVDTDALIVSRSGRSVAEIFACDGEEAFRRLEREVAAELANRKSLVIATGGRMMLDTICAAAFADAAIFTLTAPVGEILRRVMRAGVNKRPLLDCRDPEARIRALLTERAPGYRRFRQIETGGRTVAEVVAEIESLL